jgi:tRNA U34 2-thiouridine synthase MnmA/TrmU
VVDVDVPARRVVVGPPERLRREVVELDGVEWNGDAPSGTVHVQTSAHGPADPAVVESTDPGSRSAVLRWATARPRVAPGQSVVVYDGDVVLGGGLARA